jgi:four helix bundle protein
MSGFESLVVWKKSSRLSVDLYKAFSSLKDYGFRDQITRAGLSIPSNIAEGFERDSEREKANFLSYAKGSAGEVRTQILIGMEIGYINKKLGDKWVKETKEISKMLQVLATKIRNNK